MHRENAFAGRIRYESNGPASTLNFAGRIRYLPRGGENTNRSILPIQLTAKELLLNFGSGHEDSCRLTDIYTKI